LINCDFYDLPAFNCSFYCDCSGFVSFYLKEDCLFQNIIVLTRLKFDKSYENISLRKKWLNIFLINFSKMEWHDVIFFTIVGMFIISTLVVR